MTLPCLLQPACSIWYFEESQPGTQLYVRPLQHMPSLFLDKKIQATLEQPLNIEAMSCSKSHGWHLWLASTQLQAQYQSLPLEKIASLAGTATVWMSKPSLWQVLKKSAALQNFLTENWSKASLHQIISSETCKFDVLCYTSRCIILESAVFSAKLIYLCTLQALSWV